MQYYSIHHSILLYSTRQHFKLICVWTTLVLLVVTFGISYCDYTCLAIMFFLYIVYTLKKLLGLEIEEGLAAKNCTMEYCN